MSWRSLCIANPACLSIKNSQLVIKQEQETTLPLEDIGAIMIESNQVSITSAALSAMSANGIAAFVCDNKHLPCGVLLPFHLHSRQWRVLKAQLTMTKPLAKQCWKRIVEQKIVNQSYCLDFLGKPGGEALRDIGKSVKSGDADNREAYASRIYFQHLFDNFTRKDDTIINSALNYGYAVIRGYVARTLAIFGFNPAMGIHHTNELNAFNLADDFMEVFRPVVDLFVITHISAEKTELTTQDKAKLLGMLHLDMRMGINHKAVTNCIEEMIAGFSSICHKKDLNFIKLPHLLPLESHEYE